MGRDGPAVARGTSNKAATAAAERFFRAYHGHSTAPNEDSLFDLLNALHSLNDKLGKAVGRNLHASVSFTVLRKLRNLFHHEGELLHEIRMIHLAEVSAIVSDLALVCLVPRALVVRSLDDERKAEVRDAVLATIKWYGDVGDIQPCIFNAAVDVYEALMAAHLTLASNEYAAFRESYEYETSRGLSHHVTGTISCRAADVDIVLQRLFRQGSRSARD
jgi:hypothetical protein